MKSITVTATMCVLLSTAATTLYAGGPMPSGSSATSTSRKASPPSASTERPGRHVNYAPGKGADIWARAIRDETRRNTPHSLERARIGASIRNSISPGNVYHVARTVHNPSYPVYQVIGRTLVNVTLPVYSVGSDPNYQRQAAEAYGHMSGKGTVGGVSLRQAMDD